MSDQSFLRIRGLHKSFALGAIQVFTGLDLDMSRQDRLVIIGPSGGGKSTLLRCIMGLDPIDAGEIHIDGKLYVSAGGSNQKNRIERAIHVDVKLLPEGIPIFTACG